MPPNPADPALYSRLADALRSLKTPVFGVAGDSNLFLIDAFARRGGTYVAATHEGGAVLMAAAFASVTGRVGIATITQGAVTNTVTALADATRSHHPLILLTGETPDWDLDNVQRVPTEQIVRATGAQYLRLDDTAAAQQVLSLAFARATRIPGPVAIGVPTDLMDRPGHRIQITDPQPPGQVVPDEAGVAATARELAEAQRPIILAGRGAIAERDTLLALARPLGARVATTLRAKDLFRGDPADLGIFGGLASPRAAAYTAAADTLIAVGAALNSYTTCQQEALRGKRLIQIDHSMGSARTGSFLHGSAGVTVPLLLRNLSDLGLCRKRTPWEIADAPDRTDPAPSVQGRPGTVDFVSTLEALDRLLPPDRLLTIDGGRIFFESVRRLSVPDPRDYVHTMNLGSIGLGLGLAIGASTARPERLSVLVTGDGGLMLGGLSEFTTAVRNRSKLAVLIMNDGCYGAEHHAMTRRGLDSPTPYFDWPDFAPLAQALGGHGVEVKQPADLDLVAEMLDDRRWPLIVDIKLDPAQIAMTFARHPPGTGLHPGDG